MMIDDDENEKEIKMDDEIIISINGNESQIMTRSALCCVLSSVFFQNLFCDKKRLLLGRWTDANVNMNDAGVTVYSLDDDEYLAFNYKIVNAILDALTKKCSASLIFQLGAEYRS